MRIRFILSLILTAGVLFEGWTQISAKLLRFPDISSDRIVFVFGGDLWLVGADGGTAVQLTSSPGEESYPKFSPDGSLIAYTASYNGNSDVYVIPVEGGVPTRVTYDSHYDRMLEWYPDGEHLLFASTRSSGPRNTRQFFKVHKDGGFAEKLPVPYGDLATFNPDGTKIAYVQRIAENYPFKRYRGGLATDLVVFDLNDNSAQKITNNDATDGKPAWMGDKIIYVSDNAPNMRRNIWSYDTGSGSSQQLTQIDDYDVNFMSAGPDNVVFESGGKLFTMPAAGGSPKEVQVNVVSDLSLEMPRTVNVSNRIGSASLSSQGNRVLIEARGEIFDLPAKEGVTRNATQSSGALDRNPAWAPDGKHYAFWSDKSGENEIYLHNSQTGEERKLSDRNGGFGYPLFWSPDSKHIAFHDEKRNMILIDVATGTETPFDHTYLSVGHSNMYQRVLSWSPDSRWVTYSKGLDNGNNAIFLYDTREGKVHQVTSSFYNNNAPAFGPDGNYLFHLTDRALNPTYSDMGDGTWVYPNSTQIAAVSLRNDVPSLLAPKNDEVGNEKENENEDEKEGGEGGDEGKSVDIDLDGFEYRTVILPTRAGNMWDLHPIKGKVVFARFPNQGEPDGQSSLVYYDIKERKEEVIIGNIQNVVKASGGDKFLVRSQGRIGVVNASPNQKIEDAVPTGDMNMELVPKEEWYQIFDDTWRRYRDFFYDAEMQQVDWDMMRAQYRPLIQDARSRWDVSNILVELISELSAGHTYAGGGDTEQVRPVMTGKLGIDWELSDGKYRIARIVRAAPWDTEVRSPFDDPGVSVSEGDYILSVNGMKLDPAKDPYAAFEGLGGKTASLMISSTGSESDARMVLVKCLNSGEETRLRHLEWIENNRKKVDELSNGQLAYIYMPNTGLLGQRELMRMFYGQVDKKGFVIDERFNGGGQLSDRFMEMLTRPRLFNLHWRYGEDHQWPLKANDGPKAMLINGSAGSGGDAFPWAFQVLDAGPIIGERTLGILVGPATGHTLIDGGYITVPGGRLYQNNSEWFWEGYGVSPDIEIWDDPAKLAAGEDPQLERAVEEVLKLLEANPNEPVPAPPYEDRTASGLQGNK